MPPFMQPGKPSGDFRQNLTGASNGKITGANGGTQQLGAAALRRLGNPGAATGPNTKGGGLNPAAGPPAVRTPPIMDPNQKPLPGFSAAPGMTPYQPDGGGGSVSGSTAGDPGAKPSSFGPGDGVTGSGYVPNMPGAAAGPGGSPNMGGAGPQASLIAKLSGSGMSGLPGFQPAIDIGHAPGEGGPFGPVTGDPSAALNGKPPAIFGGNPGSAPWMPQVNGPDMHGGGGPLGGSIGGVMPPPGGDFTYHGQKPGDIPGNTPSVDGRGPMNTKPMPGRRMIPPETTSPWAALGAAGGIRQNPRFPKAGGNMADF